ncbi:hypothetical protein GJV06_07500 [Enterobacteriaceae bacterium RIT691]|nr:hypothetical protein [Enterobacteriaceae bacterium RIT691]
MTSIITHDCDLMTLPFNAATDFTDLADCCDRFAVTLMECNDTVYQMALLARIGSCLALLRPTLNDPIPPHLVEHLTVEKLPDTQVFFEPDAEALCEYCQALTHVLCQQSQLPETEQALKGLLCELMWMFAGDLKAPRWVREQVKH